MAAEVTCKAAAPAAVVVPLQLGFAVVFESCYFSSPILPSVAVVLQLILLRFLQEPSSYFQTVHCRRYQGGVGG